jgi:hypothetical protein
VKRLIPLLLWALPLFGQYVATTYTPTAVVASTYITSSIVRSGTLAVTATSGNFSSTGPGPNAGDLKVILAWNRSSTTIPTLPGTYTNIASGTVGSTAWRLGCNDSSSSGDIGSGTWTNATQLEGISWAGTAVGTTGNCNTTGIGAKNSNTGTSSGVATWTALTLNASNGSSWVAGFMGTTISAQRMGSCVAGGTQDLISTTQYSSGGDTNGPMTLNAMPSSTCSLGFGNSGTWVTVFLEILASSAGSTSGKIFQLVDMCNGIGTSPVSCTLASTPSAGDTLAISALCGGAAGTSPTIKDNNSNSATITPNSPSSAQAAGSGGVYGAYLLSVSGSPSATWKFTATGCGSGDAHIWVFHLRATAGTPTFDTTVDAVGSGTSASSTTTPTKAPANANSFVWSAVSTSNFVNSLTTPWLAGIVDTNGDMAGFIQFTGSSQTSGFGFTGSSTYDSKMDAIYLN